MEIRFAGTKLAKLCDSQREATREWGPANAKKLQFRLTELEVAETLQQMRRFPQARLHRLRWGARKGQYAVDLQGTWRLVFVPRDDPPPQRPDGSIDLSQITAIIIVEVVDYHG